MKKVITICLLSLSLSACFEESKDNVASYSGAAITLVSSDYSSSDIGLVDESFALTDSHFPQAFSDIALSKGKDSLYLINRYGQNNLIKFDERFVGESVWQYSTQGTVENQNSNPYSLIEANASNAYVLRYGAGEIWQVNTTAELESEFKLAEIDLSGFDEDGIPEMVGGVIHNEILYVILQRQTYFQANKLGLLIGINTLTNTLVDLDPNSESNALTLKTANPTDIKLIGDSLYITSWGKNAVKDYSNWPEVSIAEAPAYNGGIEQVNLDNLNSSIIIDDAGELLPYGQIYGSSFYNDITAIRGYDYLTETSNVFIVNDSQSPLVLDDNLKGLDIHFVEFDAEGNIWVGIGGSSNHHIRVYGLNTENEYEIIETIPTSLMPTNIVFN